jgi:hypothetical protein
VEPEQQSTDFSAIIAEYQTHGVVVIPGVLSVEQVQACREGLHRDLLVHHIDYHNLRHCQQSLLNLKQFQQHQGGGLPFYYCDVA